MCRMSIYKALPFPAIIAFSATLWKSFTEGHQGPLEVTVMAEAPQFRLQLTVKLRSASSVSYTHLTLPTKRIV